MKRRFFICVLPLALFLVLIPGCSNPSASISTDGTSSDPASTSSASSDATLFSLSLSDGSLSPAYASGTTAYTASVGYGVSSVTLTAKPTDSGATVSYSPSQTVTLPVGDTGITATVTAADGTTTKAYTVTVTRAAFAVYAVGYMLSSGGGPGSLGYWKNGTWTALPGPSGATTGATLAITTSGGSVYIGGLCIEGTTYCPGYWKDGTWIGLPAKSGNQNIIAGISVSDGSVYAVGYQLMTGYSSMGTPLFWKDGVLTELTLGDYTAGSCVGIALLNNDVYVAGYCLKDNTYVPGYWKNGTWNVLPLPSDDSPFLPGTTDIAVSGGSVYIAGTYCKTSGTGSISVSGYWKDGVWNALTPYVSGQSAGATAIAIANGSVYVGGLCTISTGTSGNGSYALGYWKDGIWTTLNEQTAPFELKDLAVCAGMVMACGQDLTFTTTTGTATTTDSSGNTSVTETTTTVQTDTGWYWDGKAKTTLLPDSAQQSWVYAIAAP